MLKVYSSQMCPDCIQAKANLDQYHIPYEIVDINETLANLKEFLRLRDRDSLYADVKEAGSIGIPTIVQEDGTITLDWQGVIRSFGYEPFEAETVVQACSLDHKGNC